MTAIFDGGIMCIQYPELRVTLASLSLTGLPVLHMVNIPYYSFQRNRCFFPGFILFFPKSVKKLQSILGTVPGTFKAQNTLRSVFPLSGIVRHIHIHRAYTFALAAGYAFTLITLYSKQ